MGNTLTYIMSSRIIKDNMKVLYMSKSKCGFLTRGVQYMLFSAGWLC